MPEPLEALERWMQALITHPQGPAAGAASESARSALAAEIDEVLLPSRELSSEERVGVYAGMYFTRLVEILREEFPALTQCLGVERAEKLFADYVHAHPSRHYSLNVLGKRLSGFLRDEVPELEPREFAVELARLERAIQDVFDAAESSSLTAAELAAVPPEAWNGARLIPIPALSLFAFEYPVNAWYQAFREDEPRALPEPAPSWLVVFRQDGRVWRMDLSQLQHALLLALTQGRTLGTALAELSEMPGVDPGELGAEIQRWFRTWAAEGFFARVECA